MKIVVIGGTGLIGSKTTAMKWTLRALLVATLPFGSVVADAKEKDRVALVYQHEAIGAGLHRVRVNPTPPCPR